MLSSVDEESTEVLKQMANKAQTLVCLLKKGELQGCSCQANYCFRVRILIKNNILGNWRGIDRDMG